MQPPSLLRSKFFWVGVLYFAQGFPFGVFYDVLPVYFRAQGIELAKIGFLALFGLSWTVKFLWAPAIDYFRHHRRWMFAVNLLMAGVMLVLISDVNPTVGPVYTLLAFVIVITGGLGSIPGALIGGLLIGFTEAMAGLLFTPSAKSMFAFGILVLVLLFRPQGILGKRAT